MGSLLIGQEFLEGEGDEIHSLDPVSDQILWSGRSATAPQVERAIAAAREASTDWSSRGLQSRIDILLSFAKLLELKKDFFAELISSEMGKPLWEAKGEVAAMCGKVAASLEAYEERCAEKIQDLGNARAVTRFKPHGVVVVFGPFNFPGHLPNGHIVPALLAGNTIVFKPSEHTPKTGQELVKLWLEAGLPDGVLNLVQGAKETGVALANSSGIDGLYFTGSSEVGSIIHKNFAGRPEKILALEMGGNNPLVVWDCKNLKAAAYATVQSAFITAGQRCTCARRLIVSEKNHEQFLQILLEMTTGLTVGHFQNDPEPFSGPVINLATGEQLLHTFAELKSRGGVVLKQLEAKSGRNNLLSPGIIDVTELKGREDREFFGPLLQLIRVPDFKAAIAEANNTQFGLSAALLSDSESSFNKFYGGVRAGIVNWNRQTTGASSRAPFGGVGLSGNHRPAAWFAADYSAFPVASIENTKLEVPENTTPGLKI